MSNGTQAAPARTDAGECTAEGVAESEGETETVAEPVAEPEGEGIDELDARLIALVQERRSLAARIQQARIDSGGGRVHLAHEMRMLDHYRRELGRPGTQLAMTLLGLCRAQP